MDDQFQDDKTKVITSKLEEIDQQFILMATDIDSKLESFSKYIDTTKKEILRVLNAIPYAEPSDKPSSSSFLGKEKDFPKKLRFINSTFKDKLINSPAKEPIDKFLEIYQKMVNFMY